MFKHSVRVVRQSTRPFQAGFATAAPKFDMQRTERDARKPPQVERAIRIKSQQRKRAVRTEQGVEGDGRWRSRSPGREEGRRAYRQGADIYRQSVGPRMLPTRDDGRHNNFHEKENDYRRQTRTNNDGIKRQATFERLLSLEKMMRGRKADREDALDEAEEIFASLTARSRRDCRIYTAMIRVRLTAGKRKDAITLYHAMKKDAVAPDVFTHMAILKAASWVEFARPEETQLIKEIHKVFEDMEQDYREAITTGRLKLADDAGADEEPEEMSLTTAFYHSRSRRKSLNTMLDMPHFYATSCGYYMVFLMNIKDVPASISLLKKGKELAAPRGASEAVAPQMPLVLAGRFLAQLLRREVEQSEDLTSAIVSAFNTVVNALHRVNREQFEEDNDWTASKWKNEAEAMQKKRKDIDAHLYNALSCLEKFQVPERDRIAGEALQSLQQDESLASLPLVSTASTLRAVMVLALRHYPEVCIGVFENAVDYFIAAAEQLESSPNEDSTLLFSTPGFTYSRDLHDLWSNVPLAALLSLNDVDRALSLMRKKELLKAKGTELSQSRLSRPYVYGHLMRKIFEARDWESGQALWQEYARDVMQEDRPADDMSSQLFITFFLDLSVKYEQQIGTQSGAADIKGDSRPTRIALKLLEKDVGLENEILWKLCEEIVSAKSSRQTNEKRDVMDGESKTEQICLSLLRRLIQAGKLALDNEKSGALKPSERRDIEAWKAMVRRAAHLRAQFEGKQSFDSEEAKWVRSGGKGRSTLALTDDDMRELLN